jgi:hypothetical protein
MSDDPRTVVGNGLKMVGEALIPGGGLMMNGDVATGLLHTAVGFAAMAFLGPVAGPITRLLVSANSYSRSVSDRNVWQVGGPPPAESGPTRSRTASSS